MRLLYHCACAEGGLAEYAREQAAALAALPGIKVVWQAPEALSAPRGTMSATPLQEQTYGGRSKICRLMGFVRSNVGPMRALVAEARRCQPDAILLSSWHEYFAPIWAPGLRRLRRQGIRIGAVIHDPVRDYVLGPSWWHRLSVREAYSFLDAAFTHDASPPDTCGAGLPQQVVQIPHGPYVVPEGRAGRAEVRRELGIPEDATVLLSFGHIRDGKSLDQVISALPRLPGVHLLVAGREQSQGQKPAGFYRDLAAELGVAGRCHFHTSYIPNEMVWRYFRASDMLLLTYSGDFRSASGVLNVNAQFGLPVLASAGRSPLLDAVAEYRLGTVIVQPDAASIAEAVPRTLGFKGEWQRFADENSWRINAERVAEALSEKLPQ